MQEQQSEEFCCRFQITDGKFKTLNQCFNRLLLSFGEEYKKPSNLHLNER